ncbi:MAG: monovalent cation:proton antiporter-2 (CPA2) family protein [Microvirga sp.]|nr:monovalent cation:proton antiporter-2 (CPA2) family protein [Microvirga sp.]
MEEHVAIPYLREAVVFLIAAGVIVPALHRLRVSPVLGYLVVGGLIGPYGLGLWVETVPALGYAVIQDLEGVRHFAELGVIFLLFMIGLELSLDRLWAMRRLVFGLGSLQVVVTALVIGLVAWEFGNSIPASIVLGACLSLSSTAIVMQMLMQSRRLASPLGRSSFSILLMQDLAVVPILFAVGVLGAQTEGAIGPAFAFAVGKAALVVCAIYLVGRLVLRPTLRLVAQARSPEMFMAAILLTVIGAAAITGLAGLSTALGAFLAGLLLAETEYRHEVEVDIEPFKGLMLGLFFVSVGMGIDWRVVADQPFWIAAALVGLFVIKASVTTLLCIAFRIPRLTALETGLLLGQGGEFAFIVVGLAMSLSLLQPDVGQFMLIVAGLSMLVTPLVAGAARRLVARLESRDVTRAHEGETDEIEGLADHVVIAGFGRVGRVLAGVLDAERTPYVALDLDPVAVAEARKEGLPVYFGDAARLEMLNRAGLGRAQAVAVTMDQPEAARRVVEEIRRERPDIPIFARARDARHATALRDSGATSVIPESLEASLQLAGRLLAQLGYPEDAVVRRIQQQRAIEEP